MTAQDEPEAIVPEAQLNLWDVPSVVPTACPEIIRTKVTTTADGAFPG